MLSRRSSADAEAHAVVFDGCMVLVYHRWGGFCSFQHGGRHSPVGCPIEVKSRCCSQRWDGWAAMQTGIARRQRLFRPFGARSILVGRTYAWIALRGCWYKSQRRDDCSAVAEWQLLCIFRCGPLLATHAYRLEALGILNSMECMIGLIVARVMRECRDHAVGVGWGGSAEYPLDVP